MNKGMNSGVANTKIGVHEDPLFIEIELGEKVEAIIIIPRGTYLKLEEALPEIGPDHNGFIGRVVEVMGASEKIKSIFQIVSPARLTFKYDGQRTPPIIFESGFKDCFDRL